MKRRPGGAGGTPGPEPADLGEIRELFETEGVMLLGATPVDPPGPPANPDNSTEDNDDAEAAEASYTTWIKRGMHGEMTWLERHARLKYRPDRVLAGCRSVLIAALNYYQAPRQGSGPGFGRVARYAWGRDYHRALGSRLRRVMRELQRRYPDDRFRPFVDASPISERHFAERSGIGFTGRNTLIITEEYGSWCVLGTILTTRAYGGPGAGPGSKQETGAGSGCPAGCVRCAQVCPTGALIGPGRIDARRCISYLTIEHRGRIDPELRPLIGDHIFGCDLCQEYCPLNAGVSTTTVPDFLNHRAGERLDLREVLELSRDAFRSRFAGTPILRTGRDCLVRNACIVAANTRSIDLLNQLEHLAESDESVLVRDHARWAAERLAGDAG